MKSRTTLGCLVTVLTRMQLWNEPEVASGGVLEQLHFYLLAMIWERIYPLERLSKIPSPKNRFIASW